MLRSARFGVVLPALLAAFSRTFATDGVGSAVRNLHPAAVSPDSRTEFALHCRSLTGSLEGSAVTARACRGTVKAFGGPPGALSLLNLRTAVSRAATSARASLHSGTGTVVASSARVGVGSSAEAAEGSVSSLRASTEWQAAVKGAARRATQSGDFLDQFLSYQKKNSDACGERLMQAKQALDGHVHTLMQLTDQALAHKTVSDSEAKNLKVTMSALEGVEEEYRNEKEGCDEERQIATEDFQLLQSELRQLSAIATPSQGTQQPTGAGVLAAVGSNKGKNQTALFQANSSMQETGGQEQQEQQQQQQQQQQQEEEENEEEEDEDWGGDTTRLASVALHPWTEKLCEDFVRFARKEYSSAGQKRHNAVGGIWKSALAMVQLKHEAHGSLEKTHHAETAGPVGNATDCGSRRVELQTEFTQSYIEVTRLRKQARARMKDNTCYQGAIADKNAGMVPLVSQREAAANKIEASATALAALEPVLRMVKSSIQKLENHIKKNLEPECDSLPGVRHHLENVQSLILKLEDCPGQEDFTMEIPKEPTKPPVRKKPEETEADMGNISSTEEGRFGRT